MLNHHNFLLEALELAKIRRGFCAPNPSVGAVIVKNNEIIAKGYHLGVGSMHAEVDALKKLDDSIDLKDAIIYVTLEPCNHWGRTPPCTDAIINSGIKHVVYGYRDPNPVVDGKGQSALDKAGIKSEHIPLPEINEFYESYRHWHTTKKPFITGKIAMTLDGKIAGKNGERIQITGAELNQFTHSCRKNSDAILTTVKTIINDDPLLNARCNNEIIAKNIYILDSQLKFPDNAKIINTAKKITLFHSKNVSETRQNELAEKGINCIVVDLNNDGLDLDQVIKKIGEEGVHDLWVEAGGKCFSAFVNKKLCQKVYIYIAPFTLDEGLKAFTTCMDFRADKTQWRQVENDVLCEMCWH